MSKDIYRPDLFSECATCVVAGCEIIKASSKHPQAETITINCTTHLHGLAFYMHVYVSTPINPSTARSIQVARKNILHVCPALSTI